MLDFDRGRPLDAQHQRAGLGILAVGRPPPLDLHRLAQGRDVGAGDLAPARHQFGAGKALPAKALADDLAGDVAQLFRIVSAWACSSHAALPVLAGDLSSQNQSSQQPSGKKSSPRAERQRPTRSPQPADLLAWYDRHRRVLPWRAPPGRRADPYHVWLSEIMLQQTTVKAVGPYYAKFLEPLAGSSRALAAAPLDDVLKAWAGLGYYARARNLHACARVVAERHGGKIPATEAALRELPGIGPYTAAAIAAIAFDQCASPVDGNIERVIARLYALETPLPAVKPEIAKLARALDAAATRRRLRSSA